MLEEDIKSIVKYRIETSLAAIEESESHLNNGYLNTAMNRIYYAGFYIVSALAAIDNFPTSKHKQLIGYFNKEYIKSGIMDPETGKILRKSYERRQAADYHDYVYLTKSQIEEYKTAMTEFIKSVQEIIMKKLPGVDLS
jgi:uncharacterized protein (UPF0332 family)